MQDTPSSLLLIDALLVFLMATGILQFLYCILVTNFPFNAFLGSFASQVGQFVLAASLRSQVNPDNAGHFNKMTPERCVRGARANAQRLRVDLRRAQSFRRLRLWLAGPALSRIQLPGIAWSCSQRALQKCQDHRLRNPGLTTSRFARLRSPSQNGGPCRDARRSEDPLCSPVALYLVLLDLRHGELGDAWPVRARIDPFPPDAFHAFRRPLVDPLYVPRRRGGCRPYEAVLQAFAFAPQELFVDRVRYQRGARRRQREVRDVLGDKEFGCQRRGEVPFEAIGKVQEIELNVELQPIVSQ